MLQLNISAEQLRLVRDWVEPSVVPFIIWLYRRSVKAMDRTLNKMVTDNANRNRDEVLAHIDNKFVEHEASAFARIEALDKSHTALAKCVDELRVSVEDLKRRGQ